MLKVCCSRGGYSVAVTPVTRGRRAPEFLTVRRTSGAPPSGSTTALYKDSRLMASFVSSSHAPIGSVFFVPCSLSFFFLRSVPSLVPYNHQIWQLSIIPLNRKRRPEILLTLKTVSFRLQKVFIWTECACSLSSTVACYVNANYDGRCFFYLFFLSVFASRTTVPSPISTSTRFRGLP